MKSALLFANGKVSEREIKKIHSREFDVIIAADGGAIQAQAMSYSPHYVVGDLDSITTDVRQRLPDTQFIHRPSQDMNDLEKTLLYCQKLNVEQITLLGISGKRLDHTLNNLSVLSRYDQTFAFSIYDAYSRIFLVRDQWHFTGKINQLLSLIPLGTVSGVHTRGLRYALNNEPLIFGKREGLSNYIIANPVSITIESGLLFIFVIDLR